jgi:hypothetical protein
MKAIFLLALVLVVANSYTLWNNWHNVPTTWVPPNGAVSNTWGLSGWSRNGLNTFHYSGSFSNTSIIYTQYLYWKTSSPDTLILCGPKYYLYSESLCRINPYFKSTGQAEYCIPNYYNFAGKADVCDTTNLLYGTYQCCWDNGITETPSFVKDMNSVDPYSTPLW